MIVPRGKIVKIRKGTTDILEGKQPMVLDSEVSINFKSNFESLVGDATGKALTLISGITSDLGVGSITGKFKEMGYKIWTGTEPCTFSFTTTFNMITSAYEDVMLPSSKLIQLCLPTDGDLSKKEIGLVAPGPSLFAVFNGELSQKENYSIRIGAFYLPKIIIESVEPAYSSDVDEDGFPIWCTLKIDVLSLFTATTNMVDDFNYRL